MKDDDYVKKLGTKHLNNEHVLDALNIAVTCYVKADTAEAIDALSVSVQANYRDPEAIKAADKCEMATEIASFREEFTRSTDELDRRVQRSEKSTYRQHDHMNDRIDALLTLCTDNDALKWSLGPARASEKLARWGL